MSNEDNIILIRSGIGKRPKAIVEYIDEQKTLFFFLYEQDVYFADLAAGIEDKWPEMVSEENIYANNLVIEGPARLPVLPWYKRIVAAWRVLAGKDMEPRGTLRG